jgi:hypothetical protein
VREVPRGLSATLLDQVAAADREDKLGALLRKRYPQGVHDVQTDRALYAYVSDLKSEFMRKAEPLSARWSSTTSCT